MNEQPKPKAFQDDVIAELRLLQGRPPEWASRGPYADHPRPRDPLERHEAERVERLLRRERAAWGERTRDRVARERRRPWSEEERWTLRRRVWRERRDRERALLEGRERALLEQEQELQQLHDDHARWLDELRELVPAAGAWCDDQARLREERGITPEMIDQLLQRRKQAAESRARDLLARDDVRAALDFRFPSFPEARSQAGRAAEAAAVARTIAPILAERCGRLPPVVVASAALLLVR